MKITVNSAIGDKKKKKKVVLSQGTVLEGCHYTSVIQFDTHVIVSCTFFAFVFFYFYTLCDVIQVKEIDNKSILL